MYRFIIGLLLFINAAILGQTSNSILAPYEGCFIQYISNYTIKWQTEYSGNVRILFSPDNGKTWNIIRDNEIASSQQWTWYTSTVKSKDCLLKIESLNPGELFIQSQPFVIDDINSYYGPKWKGLIPFLQPFNTMDYYGSGDVNCDGIIDINDINNLNEIISGKINPNIRADINGDNIITSADKDLLSNALNGDILPAWWNLNSNKEEKINWLRKMLIIDKTDEHQYITGEYECSHFASTFFRNFTGYNEFGGINYSSQTIFNIPVYYVLINPPSGIPHNLNAVLIGDDPASFSDWLFIEPQNDNLVSLNNYPLGTLLSLMPLSTASLINFEHSSSKEWTLKYYNSTVLKKKPGIQPEINNQPYSWNPVAISNNRLLYEQVEDDLSRAYKIHIAHMDSIELKSAAPFSDSRNASHLLLSKSSSSGIVNLIWEESFNDTVVYFYGSIGHDDNKVQNVQQLHFLEKGSFYKVDFYISGSKGYMFWFDNRPGNAYKMNHSEMIDGVWQNPVYMDQTILDRALIDFEIGEDESGIFHLFTTVFSEYKSKLLIYSSDKNWIDPYIIDYVVGTQLYYAGNHFFLSAVRITNLASDIGIYTRSDNKWNVIYSTYYGIPSNIVESGDPEIPFYVIGTTKSVDHYLINCATIRNSYFTDYHTFNDLELTSLSNISAVIENKRLNIVWHDKPSAHTEFTSYNLELTGLEESHSDNLQFRLNQNYPNPFNAETVISFELKNSGFVSLKVYDILGREVNTILNKWENAGEHTIHFNGSNLASGVYLYKLVTNDYTSTRKMILAK